MASLEASRDLAEARPRSSGTSSDEAVRLAGVPTIAVGTTEEVLDTLRQTKLSELRAIGDALPTRFSNALAAAAKLLEPKAQHVKLPGGTIKDEDDLKSWLTSAEDQIRVEAQGRPVIL